MQTKSSLPCFALISNIIRRSHRGDFMMEMQMEYSVGEKCEHFYPIEWLHLR